MKALTGRKILIVDDESALREILRDELEALGAEVHEAENGTQAFDMASEGSFDAVISDVRMPKGDGLELLGRLREIHRSLPIVMFVTGYADITPEEIYHRGAAAIFGKPIDFDRLTGSLIELLKNPDQRWMRRHERVDGAYQVDLTLETYDSMACVRTVNLGEGGMFVEMPGAMPAVGETVQFHILFESGQITKLDGLGIVRWQRKAVSGSLARGVGIEFTELASDTLEQLIRYISSLKPKPFIPIS